MKVCTSCNNTYEDDKLFCPSDGTPLRPSGGQTADLVGQVIADRYHIQKKLGEGGMGQVYLAEHVKMGRRCAIKIMSPAMMKDPDAISRFNREAANASRIGHPNVCAIYDFGETPDGLIYLAMEFIEGRSLNAILEESQALPLARAASIITQCADALQVAHDLGIVHRDLKPDNIMVITQRGKDTVKVVDFGIAKAVGADGGGGAQKVTKTGFVVGTPEYMSPEQLSGDPVDGRSDLYSLALVFYRMLTGGTPFPADTQQETMIKRLTDDPLPLAQARPDIRFPGQLQRVMDRALARMSEERYPTAAEFARDVRNVTSSLTGPVDVEAGTQQMPSRPRGESGAPGTGAVPATRIDPAIERQRAKADAAAKPAAPVAPRAEKKFPVVPVAAGVLVVALAGAGFLLKDTLFGTGKTGQADTSQADTTKLAGGGGQPGPIPGTNPDSLKGSGDTIKLSHETNSGNLPSGGKGNNGKPAGGKTDSTAHRDSAIQPLGTIPAKPLTLPSPDDLDDPSKTIAVRTQSLAVYNASTDVNTRALAAKFVASTYQNQQNWKEALTWYQRSYQLRPSDELNQLIEDIRTKVGN
ncbi:MAG: serine/threonine-protein kinase [Gemmatimonadales bacterium]